MLITRKLVAVLCPPLPEMPVVWKPLSWMVMRRATVVYFDYTLAPQFMQCLPCEGVRSSHVLQVM
jgi:hypothetical protein